MRVYELIEALKLLPPNAFVWQLYDGAAREQIQHVWLSVGGEVVVSGADEVVYRGEDRPIDAPTKAQAEYWHTPRVSGGDEVEE